MKGQTSFASETIMKALSFIIMTVVLVGTLVAYFQYQVVYESFNDMRQTIDFAENVMNSKCLVYEENGNFFKGVFDKNKLDKGLNTCIGTELFKTASVEIIDEKGNRWGSTNPLSKNTLEYPVLVKYPKENILASMEVSIS